jgi:hypothetical protein
MKEILRTNDPVVISFVESLLRDAGVSFFIADRNMSIMEGSLGILQPRVMVDEADEATAREIIREAGIANEMTDSKG